MTGIKEAVEEVKYIPQGDKIPWTKIAQKHGVVRSTLTRKVQLRTLSHQEDAITRRKLQPQQEVELVQYVDKLTEDHLPPTREMIQEFASNIAQEPVSDSWVNRFIHRNDEELTPQWTTSMDRNRHGADSADKYTRYFELLDEKIKHYDVKAQHTYNMDEKGFMIGAVRRQKRIFSKRLFKKKQFRQQLQDGNREWISLLACVCADGTALPPGLIYLAKSQNVQDVWVEDVKVGEHIVFFRLSASG